jgi:hypothetical protein
MSTLDASAAQKIWENWLRMWNEDSEIAHDIVSPAGFVLHLPDVGATIDPSTITSAAALADWVSGFAGKFQGLRYSTDLGPFVDDAEGVFGFRWTGSATWTGATGWPHDVPGEQALFVGVDLFRVDESLRITECWSQGALTRTT